MPFDADGMTWRRELGEGGELFAIASKRWLRHCDEVCLVSLFCLVWPEQADDVSIQRWVRCVAHAKNPILQKGGKE